MNVPGGHYAQWNKVDTKRQNTALSHSYLESKVAKLIEAESRIVITSRRGEVKKKYDS